MLRELCGGSLPPAAEVVRPEDGYSVGCACAVAVGEVRNGDLREYVDDAPGAQASGVMKAGGSTAPEEVADLDDALLRQPFTLAGGRSVGQVGMEEGQGCVK